ncbi:hypothetical protein AYR72_gp095 [Cnaphalocrocis medinalis granulovirus]|uniref:ChocGV_gp103 n=1 Tax=Cnaphalocrocis medinalis granulovirus TaxID=1750712 RepID=A0A0X9FL33_9BBAC|nr:hypothetical protein AYR72_gp095 [Cnaphalocrocis medinalis granulovirus]ALN42038.1 ChocGV_gp103 [Cnaphalocrocis medinalis granulovirus]AMF83847.1 hypothetical protein [Cnaphalocrocis medinalis granulovirus]
MILFGKQQFNHKRISFVIKNDRPYFKLVEVLRTLYDMCDHTYIDENYIVVFDEFPNTKYVDMNGLKMLCTLSSRFDIAKQFKTWARDIKRNTARQWCI